jgi:hypothetical protein
MGKWVKGNLEKNYVCKFSAKFPIPWEKSPEKFYEHKKAVRVLKKFNWHVLQRKLKLFVKFF